MSRILNDDPSGSQCCKRFAGRSMPMNRRPFDLVIFDCDGVLVDSEPIINRAHAEVLSQCGYLITEDELLARFCGMSDAEMLGIIEHERGRPLPPSYTDRVGAMIGNGLDQSLVAIARCRVNRQAARDRARGRRLLGSRRNVRFFT